jgi:hypothetical protein
MSLTFLDRFRPGRDVPVQPVFEGLAQVRGYWEGLRQSASLPSRTALDPRGLSGVLDRVFLAERIGSGLVQVRIAGSGLADFAGMDLRGLPLSCLFTAESRPLLAQSLERVFTLPCLAEMDLGADRGLVGTVAARLLVLPLADEGDRKILLGAMSFAPGANARYKFQLLARREEQVLLPPAPATTPMAVEPERRFGHLTLVHSAD